MLPARDGAAFALTAAVCLALSGCGPRDQSPPPEERIPDGVLSPEWSYTPASAETERATGVLTVEAGIDTAGPRRSLAAARGVTAVTHLAGALAPGAKVGERTVAEVMELKAGAEPMLHEVTRDGGLCGAGAARYVVWYEPEMIEGRELVLAVVQGAKPGETGSTVCRVLRYTRERDRGAGRSETAR